MNREKYIESILRMLKQASREELGNVYHFVLHLCRGEAKP